MPGTIDYKLDLQPEQLKKLNEGESVMAFDTAGRTVEVIPQHD